MQRWQKEINRFIKRVVSYLMTPTGQGMVEYVLIAAVLAIGTLLAMTFLKDEVSALFNKIASTLRGYSGQ